MKKTVELTCRGTGRVIHDATGHEIIGNVSTCSVCGGQVSNKNLGGYAVEVLPHTRLETQDLTFADIADRSRALADELGLDTEKTTDLFRLVGQAMGVGYETAKEGRMP